VPLSKLTPDRLLIPADAAELADDDLDFFESSVATIRRRFSAPNSEPRHKGESGCVRAS